MSGLILGIILLVVGILVTIAMKKNDKTSKYSMIATIASVILCVVCVGSACVVSVPTGHTGIVTTFGRVEDFTFEAGVHFKMPWQETVIMDNRNQKASIDLACFSSDIQEVSVRYTVNYQIQKANAQMIYKNIGISYYTTVIEPQINEAVRSVFAKYTAEQLLENRAELSDQIKEILIGKLAGYNIEIIDASLEDIDFSDAFTDAVEAKQVADQKAKQAKIEQEQKTMEAEAEAARAKIQAEAEAAVAIIAAEADLDVIKIQADAAEYAGQKDAAVIGQVRDVLAANPDKLTQEDIHNLLVYYYILQWNGTLPETYFGSEDFYSMIAALAVKGQTPTVGE